MEQGTCGLDEFEIALVLAGETVLDVSGPLHEAFGSNREELVGETLQDALATLGDPCALEPGPESGALLVDSRVIPFSIDGKAHEVLILEFLAGPRPEGGYEEEQQCRELIAHLRELARESSAIDSFAEAALDAITSAAAIPSCRSAAILLVDEVTGEADIVARRGLHFDAADPDNPLRVPLRVGAVTTGYLLLSGADGALGRGARLLDAIADALAEPLHRLKIEAANAAMHEKVNTLLLELRRLHDLAESGARMRKTRLADLSLEVTETANAIVAAVDFALTANELATRRTENLERVHAESALLGPILEEMLQVVSSDETTPGKLSELHDRFRS